MKMNKRERKKWEKQKSLLFLENFCIPSICVLPTRIRLDLIV